MQALNPLLPLIKKYWGYESLRPLQPEAMGCVMRGQDSVVVLPTGGGKSLCFQAPALTMDGMAVVVSPLISLMKDQVDALTANGVPAACINSAMTGAERTETDAAIREGRLKLLYVAPERVVQPNFISYLQNTKIAFLVVDEAHCISQWGHDFRPDYRALACLREAFPDATLHAYTATATEHVREDIVRELRLRDASLLVGSFDRPNLNYRVERREDGFAQVRGVIDRHAGESGLIYCIRRADVDDLCERLVQAGYRALPYHAGMTDLDRKRNQEAFIHDETDIIVATVAFGMGIDKSNVRYVVHMGMPKSIEHYQQESGRGGRDGLECECLLLYGGIDYGLWKGMNSKTEDPEAARIAMAKLNAMYDFCTRMTCRHRALLKYFGEDYTKPSCNACDVCQHDGTSDSESLAIATAIAAVADQIGDFAGPVYTTLVLSGSDDERVTRKGHDRLPSFGALAKHDPRQIRDWIETLAGCGILEKTGQYNVLRTTAQGRVALADGRIPRLAPASGARQRAGEALRKAAGKGAAEGPFDPKLFEALRQLRKQKADEAGMPPYLVFSDVALRDMARKKPVNETEFVQVHGVGQAKCEAYARDFLAAIRDYGEANPDAMAPVHDLKPKKSRGDKTESQQRANELFIKGHSIEDVCEIMQRKPATVEGYLYDYIVDHKVTDCSPWVDARTAQRIYDAADKTPENRLRPVFEALGGEVPYAQIRIALTCRKIASES